MISEALLLVGAGICLGLAGSFALTRLIASSVVSNENDGPGHLRRGLRGPAGGCWCGQLCPGPASPEGRPGHRAPLRVTGFLLLTRAVPSARFLAGARKTAGAEIRMAVTGLSKRERQIMDILYQRGKASAGEVRNAMADAPGYSAVRACCASSKTRDTCAMN